MLLIAIVIIAGLTVAFANGANDNFKGVATLFGSGTTNYRGALIWATLTTLLGSLAAFLFASQLIASFSGKGLVDQAIVAQPAYLAAVAIGSSVTVLLATWIGMPISTTHSLVGGLVGAGIVASGKIAGGVLVYNFVVPLMFSPVLAIVLTVVVHRLSRQARIRFGIEEETCFCVGTKSEPVAVSGAMNCELAIVEAQKLSATLGTEVTCRRQYSGRVLGINASTVLNSLHFLSAGLVSFARGFNDTPKIAALIITGAGLSSLFGVAAVGIVIAIGGLLAARRVAETMSHKITPMNPGQGFAANLVTGVVVIGATNLGLPVSTTHVSCGGIFGVGAVTREVRWSMIRRILGAWLLTLPIAAATAAAAYSLLSAL